MAASLQAQTAHFGYALSTLGGGFGFSQPTYVALDASGNLFVTDEGTQGVYELTAASGYSTVRTLSTAFTIPTGIAVDANENVFVTDQGTATVNELTAASSYTTVNTLGSGFSNPNGVAVDASGNVFVADTLNNAIKEILAVNGSIPAVNPTINTLAGSYNHPASVAVDSSGNVFVADLWNSEVKEILASSGYTTVNTLGTGFSYPGSVALDANDNVYVADSGNGAIKEILASGGYNTVNTLVTGLPYSAGVGVNRAGNVFIASFSGSAVFELTLNGGIGFGAAPVATPTPQTIPITFIFDTGGTIGTPAVVTQGASGLDFTDAGTGSCTTNGPAYSYNAGDSCNVNVRFTPTVSGARYGAVTLSTNGGVPIATEYISGTGVSPQVTFSPGSQIPINTSFVHPTGMAVDPSGNLFVAVAGDVGGSMVEEILASGGYVTVNTLGSGFSYPEQIAVDGSGNVFVADTYNNAIKEIVAAGGYTTVNTLGGDFYRPYGVAVDGSGNVYVADTNHNVVVEILAAGGYVTTTPLGSGFNHPTGVAVDAYGNVFVADSGNSAVKEILAAGGYTTVNIIGTEFPGLNSVALDGNGNLFISLQLGLVLESPAASGYTTGYLVGAGFANPKGMAVDGKGNVYVADVQNNLVAELDFADPPALSFASTVTGATSSDSPQTVTVVNNGNAALTFEVPDAGLNPSLSSGFTLSNSSTCPQIAASGSPATLAAGASCVDLISFTPTVTGAISGALVMTDNALNATGPTYISQSIALSGTATAPPLVASTALASAALTQNHAAGAFVPVTASGGSGERTYSVAPALPAGLSFSPSTGVISGTPTAVSTTTTYTVTVTAGEATATATFSLTVNSAVMASTAVASTILPQNHAATAFVPVTASGGTGILTYSVAPALPAGLSFSTSTGAVSGTPTAASPAATYTVTVTDSNGATATASFNLTVNSAVTASTAIASTILSLNHAATAFVPVTASGGTGTLSYSVTPALPAGLSFSSSAGAVSGTPTAASPAATYTVTVTDSNEATAMASFSLTVNGTTAIVVTASTLTPNYGDLVVLTATVTPAPAAVPPGTVNFYSGTTLLGSSALNAAGVATLSVALPLGADSITAVYSGSAGYTGSTSSALSVSARAGTATTFSASPTTQLYNNPIVLTAQVSSSTAGAVSGTVSFLDGNTVIGTAAIGSNGLATYSDSSLATGNHSLTAAYSGDGNFQASASTGTAIAITVGTVNLDLGGDQNQSVVPGAAVSYSFPLSPLVTPTFIYDVHLTATGLPPGATYTFSPAMIPAGSASTPVTLTVQTAKGVASLSAPPTPGNPNSSRGLTAVVCALLLPLFGIRPLRKRLQTIPKPLAVMLCALLGLGATLAVSGCGGGGFFGPTSASGSYTITVTATSADLVRTSTVQLTLQ